jgi:hypothetical protein
VVSRGNESDRRLVCQGGRRRIVTKSTARRILLALESRQSFEYYADITDAVAKGHAVQEDFGFTRAEIRQARKDRKTMSNRYGEIYSAGGSPMKGSIAAVTEFLETISEKGDRDA